MGSKCKARLCSLQWVKLRGKTGFSWRCASLDYWLPSLRRMKRDIFQSWLSQRHRFDRSSKCNGKPLRLSMYEHKSQPVERQLSKKAFEQQKIGMVNAPGSWYIVSSSEVSILLNTEPLSYRRGSSVSKSFCSRTFDEPGGCNTLPQKEIAKSFSKILQKLLLPQHYRSQCTKRLSSHELKFFTK